MCIRDRNELKIIQTKCRENYYRESGVNGLIVLEAYYGESNTIDALVQIQNTRQRDQMNAFLNQHKDKVVDITLSMRFFTINSSIKIHAEHKPDIVGFMKPPGVEVEDSLKISIRYSFRGIEFFRVFEEDKEIELP
eukprot:TRINITY_DN8897_c0_g2_i2.p1 TRINITY_DN8897_c0_g2~~TRINITY_DN8897_c0_g2_i2.p1  ORF type:complete len:136 (-),score=22.35 TRINITY_DN8897_c0_g2_i2:97-504(-)